MNDMMRMRSIKQEEPAIEIIQRINEEAFPPDERMSVEEMFSFSIDSEVLGFIIEDEIVGFSLVLMGERTAFVVLLAIDKQFRNKGYGSQALKAMVQAFPDKQLVLDFEEVIETADNYVQRLSRKNFYLRNGFHVTGRFTVLCGGRFEVVCTGAQLDEADLHEIMVSIHEHTPEFECQLF